MPETTVWATNEDGSIEYVQITKNLLQEALDVMHRSFYINENVCTALGLPEHPESFPDMDHLVRLVAKDGISIAAIHKETGKIAGVSFNNLQTFSLSVDYKKCIKACTSPITRNIIQWMSDVDDSINIFEHTKTDTGIEIMFVGILPEFRKRGIAKKLFEVSISLAKKMNEGIDVRIPIDEDKLEIVRPPEIVSAVCTTFVTQKIAKSFQFETAKVLDYEQFVFDGIPLSEKISKTTKNLTYEYYRL
ncbi:hypothetical protein ABEB36_008100 [Hypothenemus hampei]|uniref:N-acetyltransferase domain-containing protein n=1 Tax=Hypothenemus hampei TaxID=57062 RepID=A0ABD1EKQ3_HYPHA